jgi:peptidoglycan/LPS O-acetylase OafA/YrhL
MAAPSELSRPKYRRDIDGLRAIAVSSVVIFHAFPGWIAGGFIGVDVFFVISGYLISAIILENLDRGTFSAAEFYARRIRRIFPALLIVLVASYAFGWFALMADEYKRLGAHIAAGAGFSSNLLLWSEAGYFDRSSETKPLLHLWSLGIEEQFYAVWPLFLWLAWKSRVSLLATMAALAVVSFWLNVKTVGPNAVAAFYAPYTRLWELAAGGLLAWAGLQRQDTSTGLASKAAVWLRAGSDQGRGLANVLAMAGSCLLVFGFWRIDREASFPGLWAAVPIAGAALLLAAGPRAWINRVVLSSRAAVWIGLISYPLYLWHWPILSFARIVEGGTPSLGIRLFAVAAATVLAWLTYELVEQRVRSGGRSGAKAAVLLVLMVAVGCMGYDAYRRDGLGFREVVKINGTLASGDEGGDRGAAANCSVADAAARTFIRESNLVAVCDRRGNVRYALLGDSKAGALYGGLFRTSGDGGRWLFIGANGLALSQDRPLTAAAVRAIAENRDIDKVVLATSIRGEFGLSDGIQGRNLATYDYTYLDRLPDSPHYRRVLEGLSRTVAILVGKGKRVVLLVDNPVLPDALDCVARKTALEVVNRLLRNVNDACHVPAAVFESRISRYRQLLDELRGRFPGQVEVFDASDIYCDADTGVCGPIRDGRVLYSRTDHISDYAAGLVGERLNRFLNEGWR